MLNQGSSKENEDDQLNKSIQNMSIHDEERDEESNLPSNQEEIASVQTNRTNIQNMEIRRNDEQHQQQQQQFLSKEEKINKLMCDAQKGSFEDKTFFLYEIDESDAKEVKYSPIYNWFDSITRLSYSTKSKQKINFKCIACDYSGSYFLGLFLKKLVYIYIFYINLFLYR